jgi:hypothetical protein
VSNSAQKQQFGDEMYYPKNGAMTTKLTDHELRGADFMRPIIYTGVSVDDVVGVLDACPRSIVRRESRWFPRCSAT